MKKSENDQLDTNVEGNESFTQVVGFEDSFGFEIFLLATIFVIITNSMNSGIH